jgi:hypothetical protein
MPAIPEYLSPSLGNYPVTHRESECKPWPYEADGHRAVAENRRRSRELEGHDWRFEDATNGIPDE